MMGFFFISLPQNLTLFAKGFAFRYPNHLTLHVRYPLCNFFFKGTQNRMQIHYSVAHKGPLTASGFSAGYHRHYYLLALILRDTAVIHFVRGQQTQRLRLVFPVRTSCRWEDGKATQSTAIFPLQLTTPFYFHSQKSSTLILALHPRFPRHTLPFHPTHECAIEANDGVSLRREYQASWSDHSNGFGCQRLFSHTHFR
jgi:hypothetical protein